MVDDKILVNLEKLDMGTMFAQDVNSMQNIMIRLPRIRTLKMSIANDTEELTRQTALDAAALMQKLEHLSVELSDGHGSELMTGENDSWANCLIEAIVTTLIGDASIWAVGEELLPEKLVALTWYIWFFAAAAFASAPAYQLAAMKLAVNKGRIRRR